MRQEVSCKSKLFKNVMKVFMLNHSTIGRKALKTVLINRKHTSRKHTTKIIFNDQRLKLRSRKGCLFLALQLNIVLEALVSRIRQEKKKKSTQIRQEVNGLYSQMTGLCMWKIPNTPLIKQ